MKPIPIQVSQEYLDSLCEWMMDWVQDENALSVPGFLQSKGIPYYYLKQFCYQSQNVFIAFETMKAILHNRWVHLAMNSKKLPRHQEKMLMRYLRLYDSHAIDEEKEIKKAVAEAEILTSMQVTAENYAKQELEQPFKGIYDDNDNKRRGRGKAK